MTTTLSYPLAKDLLTEVEKERIVCTYLNSTEPNAIDWDKAATDYGAASVESYKKGMQNTIKKLRKAMDSGVQPEAAEGASTPAKNKGGRKRKEKSVAASEGEEAVEEAPKKKVAKGAKKSKAKKAAALVAAAEDEGEEDVMKVEVEEE